MRNYHCKLSSLVLLLLISTLSYGQAKQQSLPNFVNPLKHKTNQKSSTLITPNPGNKVANVQQTKPYIETVNGSFSVSLDKKRLRKDVVVGELATIFNLNENHSFQKISERTDDLGFTHTNFQQYFEGFPIEGQLTMLHSKNGEMTSMNGQFAEFSTIETQNSISSDQAKSIAKTSLNVTKVLNEYPVETMIIRIPNSSGITTKLAKRVRIDSFSPFIMCYVYIDANTGSVLNKVNLIADADVPGTAQTLYSGNQPITCDSYSSEYRLRDNSRKIETYNATNATDLIASGFTGSTDFTNSSTTWAGVSILSSFTISTVSQSWWYAPFADETPDLYIKIKDASDKTVYTSGYINNTNPPITFNNIHTLLTNLPYTVEVWDYDAASGDDFGGSYTISTAVGTQSWAGNGNAGSYLITSSGHPALDVHWGMEQTYDFYLNVLNRNSFDGNGSSIKQYLNPPNLQAQNGFSPNNAGALPEPYNCMQYGMGDGKIMNPVVGLDVEGHEYTHMVVNKNGNGGLKYEGESGALNESFADIFGTCVEFNSGVNPDWLIGEDICIDQPFLRSMSNPNDEDQPDTYEGQLWANTISLGKENDNGGVHTNSGVQNFWFYLLCEGGSGTNDIGSIYSVSGIGIVEARQIAYRNLINYLGPNATYMDAYYGSLQATEDLYGNPSNEYTAVRRAWFAVGIGNDPDNYCSGTTNLTDPSGTISDGSGSANYNNNAACKWIIAPAGATEIILNFTEFDTEAGYDTVFVYDGPDDTYPLLAYWWGNTLPPQISTTPGAGAMCIKFTSDYANTAQGWSANYTSIGNPATCDGGTILSSPTGSFSDGSGSGNYGNNQLCSWFIAPPCASSVTLSFSQFNTEQDYDGVIIYDDLEGKNLLAVYTGTTIPPTLTSTTGVMVVVFVSDYATTSQGFSANYSSTGSSGYSGVTNLNMSDYGIFTDGSGTDNYCNNLDRTWLIQPPQATTVSLNFTEFDLEPASTDGNAVYDAVEVYDGTTTSSPLLGRFSGSNLPPSVMSTGGSLLVRFFSDLNENRQGWLAFYTSTQNTYCLGTAKLTTANGTFSDGSSSNQYSNNSTCSWLIQPANASSITLSFSAFNTELDYDGVIIYDGPDNTAPVLGAFTGTALPNSVKSTGGSMFVEFLSDPAVRANGWTANYISSVNTGMEANRSNENFKIFPNPSNGIFAINSSFEGFAELQILDVLGKEVLKTYQIINGSNQIDASGLDKGIYLIKYKVGEENYFDRLVIN